MRRANKIRQPAAEETRAFFKFKIRNSKFTIVLLLFPYLHLRVGAQDLPDRIEGSAYAGKKGPNPSQVFPTVTLPRNYSLGRVFNSQDVRVTKTFRFGERFQWQAFGEAFNLLNRTNFALPNRILGLESSGAINHTSTAARQFQLAAKLEW